jgi:YHS domain-containing protein
MLWKLSASLLLLLTAIAAAAATRDPAQQTTCACCGGQTMCSATVAADERTALSDADKEAIKKQEICPVSGGALGSMGEPIKVTAKGRSIFLCCSNCKKQFAANPDKYFKILDDRKKGEKK